MAPRTVTPIHDGWQFKQEDNDKSTWLPVAQFPTNVHLDLIANNIIADPFIGKNELDVQWVGEAVWSYRTTFATPAELEDEKNASKVVLAFDGLDTYATVKLNGQEILKTESMFIRERVDVTDKLEKGSKEGKTTNELEITFESAWLKGKHLVEKYPEHKWGCWNGDKSRLAVRKAQYHYGWDWGPMLMTCGPWRPINLEVYEARISDLYFTTDVAESLMTAEVVAKADVEGSASHVRFELSHDGKIVATQTTEVENSFATSTFKLHAPKLWYPWKYGEQPLYTLTATLVTTSSEARDVDVQSKRLGLRRAELVQRPLKDQPGLSFFFKINNIPIFCGGSNWIPADNFIPRITSEKYHDWVKLVKDGNQTMLRVWGGGIFEEQPFYDACDEQGILVWQDFLFGCGNYPAFPEFLSLVKREAEDNVKILRNHPSIVLFAGNNEDYQYQESENLTYNYEDKDPNNWLKTDFPARYIYEKILSDACAELIPNTQYHPGSPWGKGLDTHDATVGDIHQWNVWHGTQEKYQNFDKLVGRFVSEFGMEAFPNIKTIDSFLPLGKDDPDRYAQSSTVDFHNKADGHERRIALYLVENLRYAPDPLEQFIYSTQLMQAECLASAYRLWKRQWKGPGREYCSGALVWQINDCWPVTSWSIVDHYLRPKHAFYTVKREMAALSCGIQRKETCVPRDEYTNAFITKTHTIEVWGSNLTLSDITADVQIKAWDVETGAETYSHVHKTAFLLPANQSTEILTLPVPVSATSPNTNQESRTVVAAYLLSPDTTTQLARYINWPEPLKYLHLPKPSHLLAQISDDGRSVAISAEVPVKGVALECEDEGVVFEDNLVDIVPGEVVTIKVRGATRETRIGTRYLGML